MCGRAANVILAPSAGCEGFARRSVTSVPARKAEQTRAKSPNSRTKPDHHMLCRNFAGWLPKIGLLSGIFHAPRTENGPYGYESLGAPSGKEVGEHAREKRNTLQSGGQLFTKVALRSNVVHCPFFALRFYTRYHGINLSGGREVTHPRGVNPPGVTTLGVTTLGVTTLGVTTLGVTTLGGLTLKDSTTTIPEVFTPPL